MFQLHSPYRPTGDQPEAIHQLVDGVRAGAEAQTLLGVTGSGKTFTVANVISEINRSDSHFPGGWPCSLQVRRLGLRWSCFPQHQADMSPLHWPTSLLWSYLSSTG